MGALTSISVSFSSNTVAGTYLVLLGLAVTTGSPPTHCGDPSLLGFCKDTTFPLQFLQINVENMR